MAYLEHEGYINRPHTSAGSIPTDKGYRFYVESLENIKLPLAEQRKISHLFHQAERDIDVWLNLTATLIAQLVQNAAVVTMPKPAACRFKHMELVSLHDSTALLVLVLNGATIRQQLITFDRKVTQPELTAIADKLSKAYSGLTAEKITAEEKEISATEQPVIDCILKIMGSEDEQEYEGQYLDGLHYTINQPEFARSQRMHSLIELVEQRSLIKSIIPPELTGEQARATKVIIGQENRAEAIRDYSVVISRYGLPEEAVGVISVIGPTRMPYARTIATVGYLSSILGDLEAILYGRESASE